MFLFLHTAVFIAVFWYSDPHPHCIKHTNTISNLISKKSKKLVELRSRFLNCIATSASKSINICTPNARYFHTTESYEVGFTKRSSLLQQICYFFQVKSRADENDKPFIIECEADGEPAPT